MIFEDDQQSQVRILSLSLSLSLYDALTVQLEPFYNSPAPFTLKNKPFPPRPASLGQTESNDCLADSDSPVWSHSHTTHTWSQLLNDSPKDIHIYIYIYWF